MFTSGTLFTFVIHQTGFGGWFSHEPWILFEWNKLSEPSKDFFKDLAILFLLDRNELDFLDDIYYQ